ncbi:MAG: hypothetical protein HC921_19325 [Synechococcaceae cyanobacterium SM2_3_1]|nr:hypothetical protein [Synechococcaceae cyanobacterium SM2_3_1]
MWLPRNNWQNCAPPPPTPAPPPPATDDTTVPTETTTAPEAVEPTPPLDPNNSPPPRGQRLTEEFCDQLSTDLSLADLEAQIGPADQESESDGLREYTWGGGKWISADSHF